MRTCCWPRASNHHYVLTTRLRGGVFKALLIFHIHGSGGCSDKTSGGGEKNLRAESANASAMAGPGIQPGKPTQNSSIERFNRTFRDEILNFYVFSRLSEDRENVDNWVIEYNEQWPHESLGNLTPEEFALKRTVNSSLALH